MFVLAISFFSNGKKECSSKFFNDRFVILSDFCFYIRCDIFLFPLNAWELIRILDLSNLRNPELQRLPWHTVVLAGNKRRWVYYRRPEDCIPYLLRHRRIPVDYKELICIETAFPRLLLLLTHYRLTLSTEWKTWRVFLNLQLLICHCECGVHVFNFPQIYSVLFFFSLLKNWISRLKIKFISFCSKRVSLGS